MKKRNVIVISENNLQNNLLREHLERVDDVNIETYCISKIPSLKNINEVDLIIIDFHLYERFERDRLLPDFDVLDLGVLVIDVPEAQLNAICVRWKSLKGVLLQSATTDHLCKGVSCILDGGLWLPRRCLERMITVYRTPGCSSHSNLDELTGRERQIMNLISKGNSNCEIAKNLFLSESTVKTHIYNIYKKLNINKRKDAIKIFNFVRG